MTIKEKVELLNLLEKEAKIAIEKNSATLAIIDDKDMEERLKFLASKDVKIDKAREIKVLAVSLEDLMKKFSVLEEIHESNLYRYEPLALTSNVIDVYKRIKYCIQNGISYKLGNEYNNAIFAKREATWKKFIEDNTIKYDYKKEEKAEESKTISFADVDNEVAKDDSIYKIDFSSFEEPNNIEENKKEPIVEDAPSENIFSFVDEDIQSNDVHKNVLPDVNFDYDHIKIDDYLSPEVDIHSAYDAEKDLDSISTEKLSSAVEDIKSDYESNIAKDLDKELEMYNSFDTVSFNDLEPESFGLGR